MSTEFLLAFAAGGFSVGVGAWIALGWTVRAYERLAREALRTIAAYERIIEALEDDLGHVEPQDGPQPR